MTCFGRREEAFEAKFAHDEDRAFKARARALRMLGLWAAGKRGETGKSAEDYARTLIEADIVTPMSSSINSFSISPGTASTPEKSVKSTMHFSQSCKTFHRNNREPSLESAGRGMYPISCEVHSRRSGLGALSLLEAAHLLLETNQLGLPVIDGKGMLIGMISEGDFLHRVELDMSPPPETGWKKCSALKRNTGSPTDAGEPRS